MPEIAPSTSLPETDIPDLSVVVASVNGWDVLGPTLEALDAQPERDRIEVIVVDAARGRGPRAAARAPASRRADRVRPPADPEAAAPRGLPRAGPDRGHPRGPRAGRARLGGLGPGSAPGPLGGGRRGGRERPERAGQLGRLLLRIHPLHGAGRRGRGRRPSRKQHRLQAAPPDASRPRPGHAASGSRGSTTASASTGSRWPRPTPWSSTTSSRSASAYFLVQRYHFARSYAGMRRVDQSSPRGDSSTAFGSLALPALLMAPDHADGRPEAAAPGPVRAGLAPGGAVPDGRGRGRDDRLSLRAGIEP